jgi:formate/nitrite transporter FocA (FNT family)
VDINPSKKAAKDERDAEERKAIGAHVVYEAIEKEAEEELSRTSAALAFSGLAAGLSIGFTLIMEGALKHHLPPTEWAPLISKFGYAIGFILVVMGRQQLFTENTLTPIIPLLDRTSHVRVRHVARVWGIVLFANLLGTALFAFAVAKLDFFTPEMRQSFHEIGVAAYDGNFGQLFVGGIFAGHLVALMMWLQPAAENARLSVIILLAYLIGIAGFPHIIAGSVEVLYLVAENRVTFPAYVGNYMMPTLLGNIIGGVSLVAVLNHAQVAADKEGQKKIVTM